MPSTALAALAVVTVTSVALYVLGRRFNRGWTERHGTPPRGTWLFQKSDDAELESTRRLALLLLPIYLVALGLYLLRP